MGKSVLTDDEQDQQPLFVRQPIFDREKSVWGYEMVAESAPLLPDGRQAVSVAEMVTAYKSNISILGDGLDDDKRLFLRFDKNTVLDTKGLPEGWDRCVFGIYGHAIDSEECSTFTKSMRDLGGVVAMEHAPENFKKNEAMESADIIAVSLAGLTPSEIVKVRQKYKAFGGKLLATDVSSWETFEGVRALGFRYFQGPFFAIAQIAEDKELSSSSVAKLQLLRELGNPECEMDELSQIIASDVSLSYRILKYINSASFGMRNKIKSIQQAVSLLGLKEVRHWATLVVMSDLDSSPKGEELAYMALQRGRFLSKLTNSLANFSHSSNTMFMLGLFSKLDALLSYPMHEALEDIPMDEDIKEALCGTLNDFSDWLMLLNAVELGNWSIANKVLGRYGACLTQAAAQYMKAGTWAAQQLPNMKK